MSSETPRVESFVLRFVADAPDAGAGSTLAAVPPDPAAHIVEHTAGRGWHGVVLHVQTNEEKPFTHLADAIAFIARYVPVGDFILNREEDRPSGPE